MTNSRLVLGLLTIAVLAISITTPSAYADSIFGEQCANGSDNIKAKPIIKNITPTLDGAEITWKQKVLDADFFFNIFHLGCFFPDYYEVNVSDENPHENNIILTIEVDYDSDGDTNNGKFNHAETMINGLECGTEYKVDVDGVWTTSLYGGKVIDGKNKVFVTLDCPVEEVIKTGGSSPKIMPPTMGVSSFKNIQYVEGGFTCNGETVDVEHFYTSFPQITIKVGSDIICDFIIYDQRGYQSIEHIDFALGKKVGQSMSGEYGKLSLDISWDGIQTVEYNESTFENVTFESYLDPVNCKAESNQPQCLAVHLEFTPRDPFTEEVVVGMTLWNNKKASWNTYFNHGIEVTGDSLNPPKTMTIAGTEKYEGLITITESTDNLWISEDGRIFDGSDNFRQIDKEIKGIMNDRVSSALQQWTIDNAINVFDSSLLQNSDKGFIPAVIDTDGDERQKTLQQLDWY